MFADKYSHLGPVSDDLSSFLHDRLSNHLTNKLFKFRIHDLRAGYCAMILDHREEVTNGPRSQWTIHGGVIASLVDTGSAFALSTYFEGQMSFATVDLHINYLSRAQTTVTCHAEVIRQGGRINVCEVNVVDANDNLVAKAIVNFILTKPMETKKS